MIIEMETRFVFRATKRLKPTPFLRRHLSSKHSPEQANPIGDYYASILESSKPPTTMHPSRKPPVSSTEDSGPSILFSSRLNSPLERRSEIMKQSTLVAGVWVPPKPTEPDNCCMSGCVNCVWDRYGEELEEWAGQSRKASVAMKRERSIEGSRRKRNDVKGNGKFGTGLMLGEGEKGATHTMTSMDDDDGGSEGLWGSDIGDIGEGEDLFKGVPVGIREFMKQEKRLKEKHARERTSGG